MLSLRLGRAGQGATGDVLALLPIVAELGFVRRRYEEVVMAFEVAPSIGGICHYCTGWRSRLGATVRLHLAPAFVVDPWVGAGAGIELLSAPQQTGSNNATPMVGPYVALQVGVDVQPSPGVRVGPYVAGSGQSYFLHTNGRETPGWATETPTSLEVGLRVAHEF
ncbi:MAG TPA: hypothetical protein VFS00_10005 [Polyangiaceae bacterium]|nr:hypothetical protein [Polyangiaceae bacterium]